MTDLTPSEKFFYEQAAESWRPARPTAVVLMVRAARELARAEAWLSGQVGIVVRWEDDGRYDPGGYAVPMPERAWVCSLVGGQGVLASLAGVTFAPGKGPDSDPYARVVAAGLARDLMPEEEK